MIDKARLRKLAQVRAPGPTVLSLYLNLDPSEFATGRDRATELQSLLDQADRASRENAGLNQEQRKQVRREIEHVRTYFESEFSAKGARGVAIFASEELGLFEIIKLMRKVASEAVIDSSPFIEPLTAYSGDDGYSVLLVSRKSARVFEGNIARMREIVSIEDDVHRWHEQGGWSQARFQRGIEKETKDHIKNAAEVVFRLFKRGRVRRLIVGAPDELYRELEQKLHPYLRERIAGRIEVEIETATPPEVCAAAKNVIEADERSWEKAWLRRLQAEIGGGTRGVTGLSDTLGVLNEKRVEALLVQLGFKAPGELCKECGHLASENGFCPRDGSDLDSREDIVESAVEAALGQSAEVIFIRHHPDLEELGSFGAVLRY